MTGRRNRRIRATVCALTALAVAPACSGGDGTDIDARPPSDSIETTTTTTVPQSSDDAAADPTVFSSDTLPSEPVDGSSSAPTVPAETAVLVSEVPETGVPGLDSDDAFCAAWSRFGGSFQVVAVNAAFGTGSVAERAVVEVIAAPTVVVAYAEMGDSWPAELESERAVALDDAFGPLARRLEAADAALVEVGATEEQLVAISDAWIVILSERDPTDPEVVIALDDPELSALVESAVGPYLDTVAPWAEDETLITDASIPLTDAFLASECPDQGTLAGGEIEG